MPRPAVWNGQEVFDACSDSADASGHIGKQELLRPSQSKRGIRQIEEECNRRRSRRTAAIRIYVAARLSVRTMLGVRPLPSRAEPPNNLAAAAGLPLKAAAAIVGRRLSSGCAKCRFGVVCWRFQATVHRPGKEEVRCLRPMTSPSSAAASERKPGSPNRQERKTALTVIVKLLSMGTGRPNLDSANQTPEDSRTHA
jgi:hypothetical protein